MVHIVECSCQIERDKHCSMSRLSSRKAGNNFGVYRRQCSACRVFRRKATLSRVERGVCQYFGQQELLQLFGHCAQKTNWAPVLADVVVLAEF